VSPDEDHVLALEQELLDPAVRRDRARVAALLDDDFVEFGKSGRRWDKAAVVAALSQEAPGDAPNVTDVDATTPAPGVVLLTYALRDSWRSSLWLRNTEGAWRLRFHQGTPRA